MASVTNKVELTGLALPAIRVAGGYFNERRSFDVAWGDLLLLLFTPIGTRPMNRQFGSGLFRLLLEPNAPQLNQRAAFEVREATSLWLPHVRIDGVEVGRNGPTISLTVAFGLANTPGYAQRTARVERDDVLRQVVRR